MGTFIAGIEVPSTWLTQQAIERVGERLSQLLLDHSHRAFLFAALMGYSEGIQFDAEMLYICTLFHNVGLCEEYRLSANRFEVDSANEAISFLNERSIRDDGVKNEVWTAIALHTTPGIPQYMSPLIALVSAGVQMDIRAARYHELTSRQRQAVLDAFPRERHFKTKMIETYARGMELRPDSTFGTVNADVLDRWDPDYRRVNFCGQILGSEWST